jgi:hypothetical protein
MQPPTQSVPLSHFPGEKSPDNEADAHFHLVHRLQIRGLYLHSYTHLMV